MGASRKVAPMPRAGALDVAKAEPGLRAEVRRCEALLCAGKDAHERRTGHCAASRDERSAVGPNAEDPCAANELPFSWVGSDEWLGRLTCSPSLSDVVTVIDDALIAELVSVLADESRLESYLSQGS